jgi:RimJ/RimL family protein N-acetyltransferase
MIKIRKVNFEDSELLLQWRNDPLVYQNSLAARPVEKADHIKWFNGQLNDSRCLFYMGLSDGVPCGSVRYNLSDDLMEAVVSISVAPEFWGKGIAFQMMGQAEIALKAESNVEVINATVLNDNIRSMKLFEKANFKPKQTLFKKKL